MANHIQVQMDQSGYNEENLRNSIIAIEQYRPRMEPNVSFRVKGKLPQNALLAMIRLADENECDFSVTVTGTQPSGEQLRLFGPGEPSAAVDEAERLIKDGQ